MIVNRLTKAYLKANNGPSYDVLTPEVMEAIGVDPVLEGPQATPKVDYTPFDWDAPGAGRRSIYRVVWRGIADPFMEALDFPDASLLQPTRTFSASALQALALFNNDFVLRHSEHFVRVCQPAKRLHASRRVLRMTGNRAQRLCVRELFDNRRAHRG